MIRLARAIRSRRETARTNRFLVNAIEHASSKSVRDELIAIAHAQNQMVR